MAKPTGHTQATEAANPLSLIACLIFYEQRQCQALGYSSSRSLRQWLFYYGRLRRQTERYAQAVMLNGVIQAGQQMMKTIIAQAEGATPEKQRGLLAQAKQLQTRIRRANNQLKRLDT